MHYNILKIQLQEQEQIKSIRSLHSYTFILLVLMCYCSKIYLNVLEISMQPHILVQWCSNVVLAVSRVRASARSITEFKCPAMQLVPEKKQTTGQRDLMAGLMVHKTKAP